MSDTANKYIHKNDASFSYAIFTSLYFDNLKAWVTTMNLYLKRMAN